MGFMNGIRDKWGMKNHLHRMLQEAGLEFDDYSYANRDSTDLSGVNENAMADELASIYGINPELDVKGTLEQYKKQGMERLPNIYGGGSISENRNIAALRGQYGGMTSVDEWGNPVAQNAPTHVNDLPSNNVGSQSNPGGQNPYSGFTGGSNIMGALGNPYRPSGRNPYSMGALGNPYSVGAMRNPNNTSIGGGMVQRQSGPSHGMSESLLQNMGNPYRNKPSGVFGV